MSKLSSDYINAYDWFIIDGLQYKLNVPMFFDIFEFKKPIKFIYLN